MKVIENKPWAFPFDCKGCGSKLEAEVRDVRVRIVGSFDDFETEYYVTCAVCETLHKVPFNRITPAVDQSARANSK